LIYWKIFSCLRTSKILFYDVISAIRTYAFKASPYPLILSLEVHCCVEQQNQMASILVNLLGEYLITGFLSDDETILPSPGSLMNKILLKVKRLIIHVLGKTSLSQFIHLLGKKPSI